MSAKYDVATDTGTLDFAASTQRPVRNGLVRVTEGTAVRAMTNTPDPPPDPPPDPIARHVFA